MDNHIKDQVMKNSLLFKVVKAVFRISVKILRFLLKIVLSVFAPNKKIKEFRKWQDDYDEHTKSITRHEPF